MLNLLIDNSISRITGLTDIQYKELKELLSYKIDPQAAYFSGTHKTKRSLFGKKGEFPTGVLYLIYDWLERLDVEHTRQDLRVRPKRILGTFKLSLK